MPPRSRSQGQVRSRWADLEARSHLPEAQAEIRGDVVRVVPGRAGRVRILPLTPEGDDDPAADRQAGHLAPVHRSRDLRHGC